MLREALVAARAQPVASVVSIIMIAGMCATVLLTTGRTVGAEHAVLGSIDSAGTRAIVIRADTDAGLDATVLNRIAHLDGITWSGAFGLATDVTNAAYPGGTRVPLRLAWGDDLSLLGLPPGQPAVERSAWASPVAMDQLGMPDDAGGVTTTDGSDYAIVGRMQVPDYLAFLEPALLSPQPVGSPGAVSLLVVIAARPDLVAPVSEAVQSVLAVDDPSKVRISTSQSLADLRALVQGQLGSYGRDLVVVIFGLTAVLVAVILYGLAMLRRKDFGRRRALGASQGLIVALQLSQMAMLALAGAVLGSVVALLALVATGDPLPGIEFVAGVALLATGVGVVGALLPALAAANRDPVTELRVP